MAKTQIKNYVFHPGLGLSDNLYPNAYSLLERNKTFIQKESTDWLQSQIDANEVGFVGYTYNDEKCERDIGYNIDAYLKDLRYGGNENLYNVVKYYWDQGVAQIDGDRSVEVAVYGFIKNLVENYILTNTTYSAINTEASQVIDNTITAEPDAITRISSLIDVTSNVIDTGISSFPTFEESGLGSIRIQGRYSTDELLLITDTTANEVIFNFSSSALGGEVTFKTDGVTDDPDFVSCLQTTDAITTVLLAKNTQNKNPTDELQIFVEKTENGKSVAITRPYDFGTDAIERMRVAPALSMLDADFEYGLQPTKWAAIGTLRGYPSVYEIPGTDTAVLTVTTDASFGNSVRTFDYAVTNNGINDWTFTASTDRAGAVSGNDPNITITEGDTINIVNNASSSHPIYIKTTPGTGTGNQVSGVSGQGTSAGGELSWTTALGDAGTYYYQCGSHVDMVGTIVVQQADEGAGVGQSLITVNTAAPHGLEAGGAFTIKALEDAVVGASRAEGSFVVVEVLSTTSFTYFAKSKVGLTVGEVLSTTYTQLRRGGFYTGADIGNPVFTVASQGSSGTIVSELAVPIGANLIPYDGPTPEIGAPFESLGGVPAGTQVTSAITQSQGGGTYLTPPTVGQINFGDFTAEVGDVTGIITGLATDRGDGTATYVTNINGNTLTFSDAFTRSIATNFEEYLGITPNNVVSTGSNAAFDISSNAGVYTVDAIANPGVDYEQGDRLVIDGDVLGGLVDINDLTLIVSSVDAGGGILGVTTEGSAFNGAGTFTGVNGVNQGGNGSGLQVDIEYLNNVYTSVSVASPDFSTQFEVGDVVRVPGDLVNPNSGTSPANDLYITIDAVGVGGAVTGTTGYGNAPDASASYANPAYTTSGSGSNIDFVINTNGTNYAVQFNPGGFGINFLPNDTILILGTALGGTSPANDLTITVDSIGASGEITASTPSGTAANGSAVGPLPTTVVIASGATFDITINAGSYTSVVVNAGGTGYAPGQRIRFTGGTEVPGDSPTNDLEIEVATVDTIPNGEIQTVNIIGTPVAYSGTGTFTNVAGVLEPISGSNFTLDVTRNQGTYSIIDIATGGIGYAVGNSFTLDGPQLSGTSPTNDIRIEVEAVDNTGQITQIGTTFTSAAPGEDFDLIATVGISELTTNTIGAGTNITYGELATFEVEFPNAHGLVPGNTFIVTISSDDGSNNHGLAAGSFFTTNIPAINKLEFQARAEGTIDVTNPISGSVYPRPDSFFVHRPFDGGVQLGTGGPQHGAQAIRQSKKYIRYQSGKGIMYTTGALFAPSYDLRSVTADGIEVGSNITIVCDDNDHGVQVGGIIRLLGVETPGYNSGPETAVPPTFDYTVTEVLDERTFKVRSQRRLGATDAVLGFGAQMSVVSWHGATVRSGIFDDQNGIFWEFDGTNLSVNQRTGTKQLAGTVALSVDSNLLTGTNTRFLDQLKAGDRIVIKGMTHVVSHVNTQTECTITPDWRGVVGISGAKINLINDKKVKQRDFNLDKLDGTGPSGYDIDIAKMQMIGIQYSWYGAGFIDFMLRGADGNFVFCHRMRNSNVNTEAFMRSGNLPVRYEVTNEGPSGKLAAEMDATQTSLILEDSSFFPDYGTVYIDNEIISFTGNNKTTNSLTGLVRGTAFTNFQAGATRQYSAGTATTHTARTGVILISQTITPLISHWGSAFITDGGFDEDRGYIFSYTESALDVSTTKQTAFLIRLSPSVSNAIVGDLGERELLNRAQLLLQSLEITSEGETGGTPITGGIVVEGVLNPKNYPTNPADVLWQTLSSEAQGGQPSFAQIAGGGGITWSTGAAATTAIATAIAPITVNLIASQNNSGTQFEVTRQSYEQNGPVLIGSTLGGTTTRGGGPNIWEPNTYVNSVFLRNNGNEYRIVASQDPDNGNFAGDTITATIGEDLINTNFAWLTEASFLASGATVGTAVTSGGSVTFPANTRISNIQLFEHGSTKFYQVIFNNRFSGTLTAGTGTIEFEFSQPPYAQPGETIFSFIAQPGERATVDFSELKELTNTPLGGRGTYPNGPDVLAINVYKVSGGSTEANVILKWGEAQA